MAVNSSAAPSVCYIEEKIEFEPKPKIWIKIHQSRFIPGGQFNSMEVIVTNVKLLNSPNWGAG